MSRLENCEDAVINAHTVLHDKLGSLFAGYGAFASRHPVLVICCAVTFFTCISIGIMAASVQTDLDELWIEEGSRVDPEMDFYDSVFGGLDRKQNIAFTDSNNPQNSLSLNNLLAWKQLLIPLLQENETVSAVTAGTLAPTTFSVSNPQQIIMSTNIGRINLGPITYTQKDFCESPEVPPPFAKPDLSYPPTSIGVMSYLYAATTQCLSAGGAFAASPLTSSAVPLPLDWGIDRFPCTRSNVLDCFNEGNFDYPARLRQLDQVAFAVAGLVEAGFSSFVWQCYNTSVLQYATALAVSATGLNPPPSIYVTPIQQTVYAQTYSSFLGSSTNVITIFAAWGYWWRPPMSSVADPSSGSLNGYMQGAISNTKTFTAAQCIGAHQCCLLWSTTKVGEQLYGGGITSNGVTATRLVSDTYNTDSPTWSNYLVSSGKWQTTGTSDDRLNLAETWELLWEVYLTPFWAQTPGTNFAPGAANANMNIYFAPWRSTDDTIKDGSSTETVLVVAAHLILIGYSIVALSKLSWPLGPENFIYSRTFLAMWGVFSVIMATVSSFGIMGIIGVDLSPISTNLVPFLTLGLGIDDMYVIAQFTVLHNKERDRVTRIKAVMREAVPAVLQTTLANVTSFFIASITPIRVVQTFVIQMGFSILLNFISLMTSFVPMLTLDLLRSQQKRLDWLCCIKVDGSSSGGCLNGSGVKEEYDESIASNGNVLTNITSLYIGPALRFWWMKAIVLALIYGYTGVMCWNGAVNLSKGLLLSDIALRGTFVRDYTDIQEEYFGSYDTELITYAVDHTTASFQTNLLATLVSLDQSPWRATAMKIEDLSWYATSASSFYAFYVSQNPAAVGPVPAVAFYPYFNAWINGIGATNAPDLYCEDKNGNPISCFSSSVTRLYSTSSTLYVQNLLTDIDDYVSCMDDNRDRADAYGVGFMFGFIYQYYDQYIHIENNLYEAVGYSLLGVFGVALFFTFSPLGSLIMALVILQIVVQLWGMLSIIQVKLNAFSVVNLSMTVGIAVEFTSYVVHTFLNAHGDRNARMVKCMEQMMAPMVNGALGTFLAVLVLVGAKYPFFRSYYFAMFSLMVAIAVVNGMIVLPVVLSLIGPKSLHYKKGEELTTGSDVDMRRLDTRESDIGTTV